MNRLSPILYPLLLLLPSCLEFDAQEIILHHDADKDQIDCVLIYRGLHADHNLRRADHERVESALKEYESVQETGKFFLWSNWPAGFNLTRAKQSPLAPLAEHIDIENGVLFTDPKGVLCGYQFLRIREASAFLNKANQLLKVALEGLLLTGIQSTELQHRFDAETRDVVREFLRSDEALLTLDGNRLAAHLPFSRADLQVLIGAFEKEMLTTFQRELAATAAAEAYTDEAIPADAMGPMHALSRSPSFRFFWDNPLSIERRPELLTIALGTRDATPLHLRKSPDGEYDTLLLEAMREQGTKIEDGIPLAEIERRLDDFRGRDAVLPPSLAAQRE